MLSLRSALQRDSTIVLPLMVIAAGNRGVDAKYNHWALLADSLPDETLVVGATSRVTPTAGGIPLWSFSNHGTLVSIAAPGEDVYGLFSGTTPVPSSGTSWAAPLVTGVAGLLLSADPNLSTLQVRDLLVQGAIRGGILGTRGGSGHPFLDAHRSLEILAERAGGPLCGNPVALAGSDLRAFRAGIGWETLGTVGFAVDSIRMRYGGTVGLYSGGQRADVIRTSGTWAIGPLTTQPTDTLISGAAASSRGLSHDGSVSVKQGVYAADSFSVVVTMNGSPQTVWSANPGGAFVFPAGIATAPAGDYAIVGVTDFGTATHLFKLDLGSGSFSPFAVVAEFVPGLTFAEDGESVILVIFDPLGVQCRLEVRRTVDAVILGSLPFQACGPNFFVTH